MSDTLAPDVGCRGRVRCPYCGKGFHVATRPVPLQP